MHVLTRHAGAQHLGGADGDLGHGREHRGVGPHPAGAPPQAAGVSQHSGLIPAQAAGVSQQSGVVTAQAAGVSQQSDQITETPIRAHQNNVSDLKLRKTVIAAISFPSWSTYQRQQQPRQWPH